MKKYVVLHNTSGSGGSGKQFIRRTVTSYEILQYTTLFFAHWLIKLIDMMDFHIK